MADNKKSVLIYTNWETTFEKLSDEEAGKLIKHLFRYVNDRNPVAPDRLTELVFEPLKAVLKQDLKKYEKISERNRINALKRWDKNSEIVNESKNNSENDSMRPHENECDRIKKVRNDAHNDNDNDNDNDININISRKREKIESEKNWKTDFNVYVEELRDAYKEIQNDSAWITQQESYYQNVDILKSIEKACVNYWSTPAGWKKKKQSRITDINWKSTFGNSIAINKVYKDGTKRTTSQKAGTGNLPSEGEFLNAVLSGINNAQQ